MSKAPAFISSSTFAFNPPNAALCNGVLPSCDQTKCFFVAGGFRGRQALPPVVAVAWEEDTPRGSAARAHLILQVCCLLALRVCDEHLQPLDVFLRSRHVDCRDSILRRMGRARSVASSVASVRERPDLAKRPERRTGSARAALAPVSSSTLITSGCSKPAATWRGSSCFCAPRQEQAAQEGGTRTQLGNACRADGTATHRGGFSIDHFRGLGQYGLDERHVAQLAARQKRWVGEHALRHAA